MTDHRVAEPVVAVHDGRQERMRHVRREPLPHPLDLRDLARLVDLPELREAAHLPLVVAPRPGEGRERRGRDVGGVDLDESVDQVEAERSPAVLTLQTGRHLFRRDDPVQEAHDVEGHADEARVVADGHDRRQPLEPRLAKGELEACLADDVVGRRRERWAWRTTEHERVGVALQQEREVRPSALADPLRAHVALSEPVLVQERADAVEHEERRQRLPFRLGGGRDDVSRTHRTIVVSCAAVSISCVTPRCPTSPPTVGPSTPATFP